jgi:hypothetical protein
MLGEQCCVSSLSEERLNDESPHTSNSSRLSAQSDDEGIVQERKEQLETSSKISSTVSHHSWSSFDSDVDLTDGRSNSAPPQLVVGWIILSRAAPVHHFRFFQLPTLGVLPLSTRRQKSPRRKAAKKKRKKTAARRVSTPIKQCASTAVAVDRNASGVGGDVSVYLSRPPPLVSSSSVAQQIAQRWDSRDDQLHSAPPPPMVFYGRTTHPSLPMMFMHPPPPTLSAYGMVGRSLAFLTSRQRSTTSLVSSYVPYLF